MVLQDFHLLELRFLQLAFEYVLKILLRHDCKMTVLRRLDRCRAQHWLVVFKQGLLAEGLASAQLDKFNEDRHFLLSHDGAAPVCKVLLRKDKFFKALFLELHKKLAV